MPQTNILRILKSLILNICSGASTWLLAFDDGNLLRRNTSGGFLVHERDREREAYRDREKEVEKNTERDREKHGQRNTETKTQIHRERDRDRVRKRTCVSPFPSLWTQYTLMNMHLTCITVVNTGRHLYPILR